MIHREGVRQNCCIHAIRRDKGTCQNKLPGSKANTLKWRLDFVCMCHVTQWGWFLKTYALTDVHTRYWWYKASCRKLERLILLYVVICRVVICHTKEMVYSRPLQWHITVVAQAWLETRCFFPVLKWFQLKDMTCRGDSYHRHPEVFFAHFSWSHKCYQIICLRLVPLYSWPK